MQYVLDLAKTKKKEVHPLGEDFRGVSKAGDEISFNNYYMEKNGSPFFGISGEFHYSRMDDSRWEDEIIKMKLGGLNIVSTYLFWIHHEEEEGEFDFTGRRDLRKFVKLCEKHGMYVILRIGPFDHGEVRNGGLPDWLYGKPFTVRTTEEGFLFYTRRLYSKIAEQVSDLFFKDNGPIIGVQIDNEFMHSSAPWEITTGISNEWVFGGNEGEKYMLTLKQIAAECGLIPVVYTATSWGGGVTPDSFLPLWGGYSFRPWIFYSHQGEHPATEEYIYQDYHNNEAVCTDDFKPGYKPEDRPYSCCEMGGGMMCCYYYRFQFPGKAVDSLSNIKMGSGCNFLGYYMFQGGSNPVGKHGIFMNEGQVPKISYDYQTALGEFGQEREAYRRMKSIHYFAAAFADRICPLTTVLPEGASGISPQDLETLRYSVRTDGKRGFVFINNFQDHRQMPDKKDEKITLKLADEEIVFEFGIAGDENAILPFHFDLDGIDLIRATAQPVTMLEENGQAVFVFMIPEGMRGEFVFEEGTRIEDIFGESVSVDGSGKIVRVLGENFAESFTIRKDDKKVKVLAVSRKAADAMFLLEGKRLIFTDEAVLEDEKGLRLETTKPVNRLYAYPADALENTKAVRISQEAKEAGSILGSYEVSAKEVQIEPQVKEVSFGRYTVKLPAGFMKGLKDARLEISYHGDIGSAFLNGKMIHDNFANGAAWTIGLKEYAAQLENEELTIYIAPLKKGAKVNVESAMAARMEKADALVSRLDSINLQPVYEIKL